MKSLCGGDHLTLQCNSLWPLIWRSPGGGWPSFHQRDRNGPREQKHGAKKYVRIGARGAGEKKGVRWHKKIPQTDDVKKPF